MVIQHIIYMQTLYGVMEFKSHASATDKEREGGTQEFQFLVVPPTLVKVFLSLISDHGGHDFGAVEVKFHTAV